MTRIRSVLASLTGAAIAATLAFGIGSAAAQPAAPTAGRADWCEYPPPGGSPLEVCECPDGSFGYCSLGTCEC